MLNEIILAIIQAATEFLPISSSGHLALASNLISEPNLFLITTLHLASLIAVLIFTRKEIFQLITFKKEIKIWWIYLIAATIPAGLFGLLFKDLIESAFNSYLTLAIAFFFTGTILILTKFAKEKKSLKLRSSIFIGLMQTLALFPGVSRSGMTISTAMFNGVKKEQAAKFSFVLFIPLSLAAFAVESSEAYFSIDLLIAFVICLILSILFLNLLMKIIKKNKFWIFGIYCIIMGIISLGLWLI